MDQKEEVLQILHKNNKLIIWKVEKGNSASYRIDWFG